jgi:glycosyltransferase involved in cell wall biosynthesis
MNTRPALLVFSHLRWNFVYQRPQHLLSRLARQHRVVFVEEPVHAGPQATAQLQVEQLAQIPVTVLRLASRLPAGGFDAAAMALLRPLLGRFLAEAGIGAYLAWFYTPMALPLLGGLTPRAVVYDCMDELAAFKDAPAEMGAREDLLLTLADLVLTGGPSLYEAKRHTNAHVYCLPSAVDAAHYVAGPQRRRGPHWQAGAALQRRLARPRLGFFGVIDERLDLDLIAGLADLRPKWHLVLVGPVCKREAHELPRRPNLHWLGQQPYERLPALVHGWDVCLLPFALNRHTRFISPTKTLEYLAAGKPVVSTPIHDVARLYGDVVRLAADAPGFVAAIEADLACTPAQRTRARRRAEAVVTRCSWDAAAARVQTLIERLLQPGRAARPAAAHDRVLPPVA